MSREEQNETTGHEFKVSLKNLIAQIGLHNVHQETDWGQDIGNELIDDQPSHQPSEA